MYFYTFVWSPSFQTFDGSLLFKFSSFKRSIWRTCCDNGSCNSRWTVEIQDIINEEKADEVEIEGV